METEKERDGFDRRQFLRRAAVAGAAAAWAAPVIKTVVGTPAFAKNVTGSPKDLSYVAVFYSCGGETCAVKWDMDTGVPETGNFNMPDCGGFSGASCGDPALFNLSSGGSSATVCLTQEAFDGGCRITSGVAKAGSFQSTSNPCAGGAVSEDGSCISFSGVGTQPPS
ncbi:MAG TPA: twin-arginine translocation signal domain-containing protein [Jiangellaceae bacterium]